VIDFFMPVFQFSPKHKRNIFRILPFGLFWTAFGLIYSLMEKGLLGNLDHTVKINRFLAAAQLF